MEPGLRTVYGSVVKEMWISYVEEANLVVQVLMKICGRLPVCCLQDIRSRLRSPGGTTIHDRLRFAGLRIVLLRIHSLPTPLTDRRRGTPEQLSAGIGNILGPNGGLRKNDKDEAAQTFLQL